MFRLVGGLPAAVFGSCHSPRSARRSGVVCGVRRCRELQPWGVCVNPQIVQSGSSPDVGFIVMQVGGLAPRSHRLSAGLGRRRHRQRHVHRHESALDVCVWGGQLDMRGGGHST